MSKTFPTVSLGIGLRHRSDIIEIDDLEVYKRCRVQLHAQGIIERDVVLGSEIKTKKQQVCRAKEFLVAEIDAKLGGFGIVPEDLDGAIVSSHYFLFTIDETVLNQHFLDFFVRTPTFMAQVRAKGTTNYAAIRPNDVLQYEILLPPLEEQQCIVTRIEELVAKVEKAQGLHQKAIEERELLKKSASHALFFGHDKISQPLRDLVTVSGGGTPSKSNPFFWEGTIPWISPKDMKTRDISDAIDHISDQAIKESSAKLIDPGAVLIVVRGMILTHTVPSAILRIPAAINQDMKALIPNEKLLPEYLRSGLWALNEELLNLVEKSTHDTRKLETSKLLAWKIPVPPISEQQRIVTYLEELQSKVDALKRVQAKTSTKLDAMLPSILDKAFRGEL